MHKNRVRGYNKRFYPGVALIVAAMLCLVFALTRLNVPLLQLQNKYFNLKDITKNEDSILKVTGIDKHSVQNSDFGKWSLYIVSYLEKDSHGNETTQYIGLELDEETAKQLIDKKNTLRDHPEKVAGTFVEPEFHGIIAIVPKMRWKNTSKPHFHVVIRTIYRLNQERKHKNYS